MTTPYEVITDRIVQLLDRGIVPWRRPWRVTPGSVSVPTNGKSGRAYRGLNFLVLSTVAMAEGYQSNIWLTFKQVTELGGKVVEGSKGTSAVFWKQLEVADPDAKDGKKRIPLLRYFTLFNLGQTEGVKLPKKFQPGPVEAGVEHDPITAAEAIVAGFPNAPKLTVKPSSRAFYQPSTDAITVPVLSQYENPEEYYSTLFHELGHSTGHKSRLGREGFGHFGSEPYAKEELVAEMTAAFLCAEAGIDNSTIENSAAYIASWRSKLQEDPKLLVGAASKAQKAADHILGRVNEWEVAA